MLYLASQSPRRRELLEQLGLRFRIVDVNVPEQQAPGESAEGYVRRVAHDKALAGFRALSDVPDAVVLGADTEVVLEDQVFGKPRDVAHAAQMLQQLSERTHRVLSAVCCIGTTGEESCLQVSRVRFGALSEAEIKACVASGECMGKAGAYAIQGRAAAFIADLQGSYSGVMGLPLYETAQLLTRFGELS